MKILYSVAMMPIEKVFFWKNNSEYWIDEEMLDYIEKILGGRRILLSAGLWAHYYGKKLNKKNSIVLADSGGFQYLRMSKGTQKEFYRSREQYYKWQISVGDIVVMGDIPSAGEVPRHDLERFLGYTIDNVNYQIGLDPSVKGKFLNVMHGISPSNLRLWYDGMKDYECMGWAIGAKPVSNFIGFALQFLLLYEKGEFNKRKFIHIFGVAGARTLFPLLELIHRVDDSITVSLDSSSQSLGRIGAVWTTGGTIVHYNDIRSGRVRYKLLNGPTLDFIPDKIGYDLGRSIAITSMVNYLKFWKNDIYPVIEKGGQHSPAVDRVMKLWKTGGIDAIWFENSKRWRERSVERLV